jgi:molecular chaperone DnaJ
MKDYYETLGVSKESSTEEIKKAYKKLAKKYHPDLHSGDATKEEKFKEINEAHKVLSDSKSRANYDRFGTADQAQGFDYSQAQGFDYSQAQGFEDIFSSFFGGGDSFFGGRRNKKGYDIRYDLEITLEQVAFGTEETISFRKKTVCEECKGTGAESQEEIVCQTCNGQGRLRQTKRTPLGMFQTTVICDSCEGLGKIPKTLCNTCSGQGSVNKSNKIKIKIPAGVDTGYKLRIAKEGEAGGRGETPGDLYLFITVKENSLFEREENDIYYDANISFIQATLGCEIKVPTLKDDKKLKIPQGTQPGTLLRMKGLGIKGTPIGDQMVRMNILIPEHLSKKEREILEFYAEETGEDFTKEKKGFFEKVKNTFS